jgi:hypothetical protein
VGRNSIDHKPACHISTEMVTAIKAMVIGTIPILIFNIAMRSMYVSACFGRAKASIAGICDSILKIGFIFKFLFK